MIYEELLVRIDKEIDDLGWNAEGLRIVRSIVELHKPKFPTCDCCDSSVTCFACDNSYGYPCETIKTIERGFDE